MFRLQIIGGGRMGEALLGGLVRSGWAATEQLVVVEIDRLRTDALTRAHPGLVVVDSPVAAEGTVVAVKPADVGPAVAAAVAAGDGPILSIAAGVTLQQLETAAGPGVPVVRAMPNTPSLVGQGAAAISGGSSATEDHLVWAEAILGSVGLVVRVPESALDAVTAVSGSGPAYVFLLAEALIDAGVTAGLGRDVATALVTQTLLGSATLLAQTDQDAAALRHAVTSPGGTTAAALAVFERRGVRGVVTEAVLAAAQRSRELAR